MPECIACRQHFPAFKELALHIMSQKTGHRRSKIWAAKYLTNVKYLDEKVTKQSREGRTPLTEEQKEAKRDLVRTLSGETQTVLTVCPRCKRGHTERIEVEYLQSETAWRSSSGHPMVICTNCKGEK